MSKAPPHVMMTAYRRDLLTFSRKSFSVLNSGTQWKDNWHLEATCYQLRRVLQGTCKRLIITLPPRSLKSHLGSIALPAYMLGIDPTGIAPRSVELCEASAAVNDVKRPSRFEQLRDCLFPFRSEQQARLVRPEVA
jgi:hypothetical protein